MAKTYVENARVERIFQATNGSTGVTVVEENTVGDRVYKLWLTLWFRRAPEVEVGWRVNASGHLSQPKVRPGKDFADVNLNGAVIQSSVPADPPAPEVDDAWDAPSEPVWH